MNLGLLAVAILIFCITVGAYMLALYKVGDVGWEWFCVIVPILFSFGFTIMAVYLLYLGGVCVMSDYIPREAVLLRLNDIWLSAMPTDTMYDDDRQLAIVRCMGLNDAMDAVKEAPAADVRPVVRGHWITEEEAVEKGDYLLRDACSVCGHCDWDCTESASFNYCPNCGAKMEGKRCMTIL